VRRPNPPHSLCFVIIFLPPLIPELWRTHRCRFGLSCRWSPLANAWENPETRLLARHLRMSRHFQIVNLLSITAPVSDFFKSTSPRCPRGLNSPSLSIRHTPFSRVFRPTSSVNRKLAPSSACLNRRLAAAFLQLRLFLPTYAAFPPPFFLALEPQPNSAYRDSDNALLVYPSCIFSQLELRCFPKEGFWRALYLHAVSL